MAETCAQPRSWSDLPSELLQLVLGKLSCVDIMRFKVVCSCWCLAANSYISSPLYSPFPQSPWLMYLTPRDNFSWFFNMAENKVHKLDKCISSSNDVLGSSHGWLIQSKSLLNPVTGAVIQLPPLDLNIVGERKAILTSNPSRSESFFVVVISLNGLAYHMHEEHWGSTWTLFGTPDDGYYDITFHNDSLYAMHERGTLEIWKFLRSGSPEKTAAADVFAGLCRPCVEDCYLVESLGEILCVLVVDNCCRGELKSIGTKYRVYKIVDGGKRWEEVKTLNDQALFLGWNHSVAISARDFPEWKRNSIYLDNRSVLCHRHHDGEYDYGEYDYGVYDLEEDVMCLHCMTYGYRYNPNLWIVSVPW